MLKWSFQHRSTESFVTYWASFQTQAWHNAAAITFVSQLNSALYHWMSAMQGQYILNCSSMTQSKTTACCFWINWFFFLHLCSWWHIAILKQKTPYTYFCYLTSCLSWWGLLSKGNHRAGMATYWLLCVSPAISNSPHHMLTLYSPNTHDGSVALSL